MPKNKQTGYRRTTTLKLEFGTDSVMLPYPSLREARGEEPLFYLLVANRIIEVHRQKLSNVKLIILFAALSAWQREKMGAPHSVHLSNKIFHWNAICSTQHGHPPLSFPCHSYNLGLSYSK